LCSKIDISTLAVRVLISQIAMTERQEQILNIIINEYVKTSEPVGSNILVEKYNLGVSPATARLEMARLEKEGYIYQPHTSAGRVPTDKGYRWFVSSVQGQEEKHELSSREQGVLKKKLTSFSDEEKAIKMAAHLLSDLTYCAALATLSSNEIYYHGIANIFRQPEFEEKPAILGFADLIDHLNEFLKELPHIDREIIYIGEESPYLKKAGCSMIVSPYHAREREGVLGLVGPTRMSYDRNLSLLDFVTSSLEEF